MPIRFYLCEYKQFPNRKYARYCGMNDFTPQIEADGGQWGETEYFNGGGGIGAAVVKLKCSLSLHDKIRDTPGFRQLALDTLTTGLSNLTDLQLDELKAEAVASGKTVQQVNMRFPDLKAAPALELLKFICDQHPASRFDEQTMTFVIDGPMQAPGRSLIFTDAEIQ